MPSREMRVMIPEPVKDGNCAPDCPMMHDDGRTENNISVDACRFGVTGAVRTDRNWTHVYCKPGPGCPQHRQEKEEKANG